MYQALLWNQPLEIETTEGLFSPRGADAGTLSMVSAVELESGQKLLDLGCGAGLVGIAAAKVLGEENVWMTDVDPAAVRCAAENAKRNGVENVHLCCGDALDAVDASGFDWILSNPPYHADFSVAKKFIEKGFNRLKLGGKLVMVVKRELWYRNKLTAIFGGVRMQEIGGYFVFTAEKRSELLNIKEIYKAKIVDLSPRTAILELTGEPNKLDGFLQVVEPYGILEMARTGVTALSRGEKCLNDLVDYNELI